MKKIALIGIIIAMASSAQAAETITVKDINEYLPTRNFNYSGPGPYLIYFNAEQKISAQAHAAAKKFKADTAILNISNDVKELIKQIDFTATICNPWSGEGIGLIDLKPELISLKDEKKKLLQEEVSEAAKKLFNVDLTKADIASIKEGEKSNISAFTLVYKEYWEKCDTNGGRSIYYKMFVKNSD